MTSIGDLYRAQRAAQSGSAMYRVQPAAPPAPAPYERAAYGGLAGYMAEREPVEDKRSPEAIRRATVVSAWGIAAQRAADEVSEEDWKAHRAAQDASGVDRGLIGKDARQAYQAQLAANRFGRIQAQGHLSDESSPGQAAVPRVYAAQIRQEQQHARIAALRSTGEGWR